MGYLRQYYNLLCESHAILPKELSFEERCDLAEKTRGELSALREKLNQSQLLFAKQLEELSRYGRKLPYPSRGWYCFEFADDSRCNHILRLPESWYEDFAATNLDSRMPYLDREGTKAIAWRCRDEAIKARYLYFHNKIEEFILEHDEDIA